MKILKIIIPVVLLLYSCQSDQDDKKKSTIESDAVSSIKHNNDLIIKWVFESEYSNEDYPTMPVTDIFVEINGRKIKVFTEASGSFAPMDKEELISWKAPETALSACFGGWAGLFLCVYIEKDDNELIIKQAWSDAESDVDSWMDVEVIKKIKVM